MLVAAIAQRIETGGGGPEIDDDQEEGRERVDAEVGTEPRQA